MLRTSPASHLYRLAAILSYLMFAVAWLSPAVAQTPSGDQMEMFQNMTPEQQQAVLEAMSGSRSAPTATTGVKSDRKLDFPQTMRPRTRDGDDDEDETNLDGTPRKPRFKAGDTLLLSLEIRQFKRKAPEIEEQERRQQEAATRQPSIPGRSVQVPMISETPSPTGTPQRNESQELLERTAEDTSRLEDLRERILRRNPYKLDKWGILNVPELGPVPLAGLTVEEATQRIASELSLSDFVVLLTRLPLKPLGSQALKPFGYDLFSGMPSTFAPATDVPVPTDYVIGPGDTLQVQLFGSTKGRYVLVVARDGRINFPELGPIAVSGQRFDEVRANLEETVRQQMIGTQVAISMGELRSIQVFVLGDVETPGAFTVSGLSTITNALYYSGGAKKIGSLRGIQLKRGGRTAVTLDLYDLLLNGDTRDDVRLQPGDVVFVPPIGATVGLGGEVRRPAIYELKKETTVAELLELGGGLRPEADPAMATLERINDQHQRTIIDVNLVNAAGRNYKLQTGDVLRVPEIRPVLENSVVVSGHVHRPGEYQFKTGMRLTDVLPSLDELEQNADQRYIVVRRELPTDRRVRVFSADLEKALASPESAANFDLAPRDQIFVFDRESGRDRIMEPLMRELQMQSRIGEPTLEVSVAGKIKVPGKYPLEPGMRVSDLLRAGGSLDEAAYGGQAELTRYEVSADGSRQAQLIEIDLRQVLSGDPSADLALKPFDYLVVKEVPLWASQEEVEIRGEVRFPGRYPIHRGETLRSVMERAGGLTDLAFAEGAVFTREELKDRERKQLATLAQRMESDVAQASLMAAQEAGRDASQALTIGRSLLANLRDAKPVGRLVINLDRSATAPPGSEQDIVLKNGDRLLVPRVTQEVTVIGEVQSTTSHLYRADLSRDDYIAMSGGLTPRADEDRIYVVRADGSVVVRSGSAWFNGGNVDIRTGDTIVAPLDTERMRPLTFWTSVMSIVYQLAVGAAAVNSFNN